MTDHEWSRSRYWLCHYLYNRHVRPPIPWSDDLACPLTRHPAVTYWLSRLAAAQAATAPWLINQAMARWSGDPAYIQSLRLLIREQRYHGQLLDELMRRAGQQRPPADPTQDLFLKAGRTLGVRYTLSAMLLSDLIDVAMLELFERTTADEAVRAVCQAIIREKRRHITFHTERLTMEFADFNFARRNLRRLRLRMMYAAKLARLLYHDHACIGAMGASPARFVRDCWRRMMGVIEEMVPYRRDALMAALLTQDSDPYHEANDVFR